MSDEPDGGKLRKPTPEELAKIDHAAVTYVWSTTPELGKNGGELDLTGVAPMDAYGMGQAHGMMIVKVRTQMLRLAGLDPVVD